MLEEYTSILSKLLAEFPKQTAYKLTESNNWNLFCQVLAALEENAAVFQCIQNEDKLTLLGIVYQLLSTHPHSLCTKQLFNDDLISMLTSQFMVSTRSEVVSPHMQQVVCLTFQILTHFARVDVDEEQQSTSDSLHRLHDDDTDLIAQRLMNAFEVFEKEKVHWINHRIVSQQWFLLSISEIVTPHNVFNSAAAANCILDFLASIIDCKYMRRPAVRHQIIDTVCKKWRECDASAANIRHYPRDAVFKLLRIVLQSKDDHHVFFAKSGFTLLQRWIRLFVHSEQATVEDDEVTEAVIAALDFWQFHVHSAMKHRSLISKQFVNLLDIYLDAVCRLYCKYVTKCSSEKRRNCLLSKCRNLLQAIFDVDMKYFGSTRMIISRFLKRVVMHLLPLKQSQSAYNLSRDENTTYCSQHEQLIEYLQRVNERAMQSADHEAMKQQLDSVNIIEAEKQVYTQRIVGVFEIFLHRYHNTEKLYWADSKMGKQMKSNLTDIFVVLWMLQLMHCKLPRIVTEATAEYLSFLCRSKRAYALNSTVCSISYGLLMTSSAISGIEWREKLNMNVLLLMTKSVIESVSSEQHIDALIVSRTVHRFKKFAFSKYLPLYLEQSMSSMIRQKNWAFLEFYLHGLCYKEVVSACMQSADDAKWWTRLAHKMCALMEQQEAEEQLCAYLKQIVSVITSAAKPWSLHHHTEDGDECALI